MSEQGETPDDAVMTRIGQAVMLLHAGDREEARNRFGELWQQIGECGPALHRCTLAHYMADTQDDPGDELAWDLRALSAAQGLADEAAFHPALHLNLAADYLKLQRLEAARVHLDRARAASAVLTDDPYGKGVRAAIVRLEGRLAGE
ncbi:hypothetical protein [Streptomyces sp. NPDC059828]|uniref:hypothetical protein n=1 Tax=Streptomyces sp. NPDC059828 TaxID=3346965 RepID=UPI00364864C8